MNARAYFTILRPGRTLVLALPYLGFIYIWLRTLFHVPTTEALALQLAVFGPATLGSMLLGPLHEVMHRSVFPLLPDARRQFRRWHLRTLSVTALLFLIPATLFSSAIPAPALIGLIVASLSIPLLNRRQRLQGQLRPQFLVLLSFGVVLASVGRGPTIAACNAAPWAILAGGLVFASLCFRSGFSSRNTRDRWRDPVLYCAQSTLPFVGTDIQLHAQSQNRQLLLERKTTPSRDWNTATINLSWRGWSRALHHARFGYRGRFGHLVGLGLATAGAVPFCIGIIFGMEKLSGKATTMAQVSRLIIETGKVDGSIDHPLSVVVLSLIPMTGVAVPWLAAMLASLPASTLPISRRRLAGSLFLNAHRTFAALLAINILSTVLSWLVLSSIAGVPFEFSLLARPLAAYLILPSAISLALSTYFIRRALWRHLASSIWGIGFIAGLYAIEIVFTARVLSPLGLLLSAATTAGSVWLSWQIFHHYYQTCDLNQTNDGLRKLGIGLT